MRPPIDKNLPQILSLAIKRAGEWHAQPWKWLYRIRNSLITRYHQKLRSSTRTLRLDQRLAIQAILKTIIRHLDLSTMCVGYYHKETGAFIHLSLEYLAYKSGINHRRAQRAIKWLYEAGYITQFRRSFYDEETETYVHKPAVRRVNPILLLDLGITHLALESARRRSKNKVAKFCLQILPITNSIDPLKIQKTIKDISKKIGIISQITPNKVLPETYTEKIHKLLDAMPNITIDEAKAMLPDPRLY